MQEVKDRDMDERRAAAECERIKVDNDPPQADPGNVDR
jgi:hypothetical protein